MYMMVKLCNYNKLILTSRRVKLCQIPTNEFIHSVPKCVWRKQGQPPRLSEDVTEPIKLHVKICFWVFFNDWHLQCEPRDWEHTTWSEILFISSHKLLIKENKWPLALHEIRIYKHESLKETSAVVRTSSKDESNSRWPAVMDSFPSFPRVTDSRSDLQHLHRQTWWMEWTRRNGRHRRRAVRLNLLFLHITACCKWRWAVYNKGVIKTKPYPSYHTERPPYAGRVRKTHLHII